MGVVLAPSRCSSRSRNGYTAPPTITELGPTSSRALIIGPLTALHPEATGTGSSTASSSPASRCWWTTSPPASSAAHGRSSASTRSARSSSRSPRASAPSSNALVKPQPAAARVDHRRARQGAVPEQRDQQRRAHAARREQAQEAGKSILFMIESNPGPGLGILTRDAAVRPARRAPDGAGRDRRPLPRRHPRDLLPVRADEADPVIAAILGGAAACSLGASSASASSAPPRRARSSPTSWCRRRTRSCRTCRHRARRGGRRSSSVPLLLGFGRNEKTAMDLDEANAPQRAEQGPEDRRRRRLIEAAVGGRGILHPARPLSRRRAYARTNPPKETQT